MSGAASNIKKNGSGNNSIANTPSATPVSNSGNMPNGQVLNQSSPPPNNAPKYGTLVPNRIFVGGISAGTSEGELHALFSSYGVVKAAKIISDRAGVSKGYGFITFESEDDARRLQREADNIVLRERKLNIAPAIKKQPFGRAFDASSPPAVAATSPPYYFPPGTAVPFYQSGMAYYQTPQAPTADMGPQQQPTAIYQAPAMYPTQTAASQSASFPPMMFPQPIYMPHQYPMPVPYEYNYYNPHNGGPQYVVGGSQAGPPTAAGAQGGPPVQPPGSPPRPPCYAPQLQYNPADAAAATVYYGFPVYSTVDGSPMYATEPVDMVGNGCPPYAEEPYQLVDGHAAPDLIDPRLAYNGVVEQPDDHHQPPPLVIDVSVPPPQLPPPSHSNTTDTTRQSSTPVVSLLSIGDHHERDYNSMQGGRRRKSIPTPQQPHQQHHPPQMLHPQQHGPPHHYNGHHIVYCDQFGYPQRPIHNGRPMMNGYNPRPTYNGNVRRYNARRDSTNVRSSSNSPLSVNGENKTDEKGLQQTGVTSPPPAPYSPIANHNAHRNYNGHRNNRGGYNRTQYNSRRVPRKSETETNYTNQQSGCVSSQMSNPATVPNSASSMGQQQQQQHFVPPARNPSTSASAAAAAANNRSNTRIRIRRNNSSGVSEIGAGDAPLPGDVSDACKKLESLKL